MIKNNQKYLNGLQYVLDVGVVVISLAVSYFIRFSLIQGDQSVTHLSFSTYMSYLIVLIPITLISFQFHGLYKPQRRTRFFVEMIAIGRSIFTSIFIILALLFLNKEVHYSRSVLSLYALMICLLMVLERAFIRYSLRYFRSKGYNLKHVLIIGATDMGSGFAEKIKGNPQLGYNIVGFLDDFYKEDVFIGSPCLGETHRLEAIIKETQIDEVIIALPIEAYNKVSKLINLCEYNGIKVQIIPAYQSFLPARPYFDNLEEIPLINIRHIPLDEPLNALLKRSFDILISLCVLILSSPLLLLICIGVKFSSPGPIFFKQERVGMNRKSFNMYKFRSMRMASPDEEKEKWTIKNDPRKTRFGSFIRKTSIDELPQFVNVLKGEMSIIGPRPERPYFVDHFKDEIPKYMVKHHVRPGITGWAQVNGWRGDTSIEKRIEYDIYYIENWTLGMDVHIFVKTFFVGFINKNAY